MDRSHFVTVVCLPTEFPEQPRMWLPGYIYVSDKYMHSRGPVSTDDHSDNRSVASRQGSWK
ncbi:hypothetical protein Plhal304r1_c035g0109531 [Plasmopara halstedii]